MDARDISVGEFMKRLSSADPTPGGGAVAALLGAMGCSLLQMTANLTLDKKKYAGYFPLLESAVEKADALLNGFLRLADRDAEAFRGVIAAMGMPKDSETEKEARKAAMQAALKESMKPPFETLKASYMAMNCAAAMLGKINPNVKSDLAVAASCFAAAAKAASVNVSANLAGIEDADFVSRFTLASKDMVIKATDSSKLILEQTGG